MWCPRGVSLCLTSRFTCDRSVWSPILISVRFIIPTFIYLGFGTIRILISFLSCDVYTSDFSLFGQSFSFPSAKAACFRTGLERWQISMTAVSIETKVYFDKLVHMWSVSMITYIEWCTLYNPDLDSIGFGMNCTPILCYCWPLLLAVRFSVGVPFIRDCFSVIQLQHWLLTFRMSRWIYVWHAVSSCRSCV
jgi:hypothetical protein